MKTCPTCGEEYSEDQIRCPHCGQPADPLDHAFRPFRQTYDEGVEQRRSALPDLRAREEAGSQDRLDLLEDIDRRRMRLEAERSEEKSKREKRIVILASSGVVFFVFVGVIRVVIIGYTNP
jgi:uncharacterized membrane protein YvbJ